METKLNYLYSKMFGEIFDPSSFPNRLKLQKAVYLVECCGINLGDYNFFWHKHGPYSQILQNEILANNAFIDEGKVIFNEYQKRVFEWFQKLVEYAKNTKYKPETWLEAVASIHYIMVNVVGIDAQDEKILQVLNKRKPLLNDEASNKTAIGVARSIVKLNQNDHA